MLLIAGILVSMFAGCQTFGRPGLGPSEPAAATVLESIEGKEADVDVLPVLRRNVEMKRTGRQEKLRPLLLKAIDFDDSRDGRFRIVPVGIEEEEWYAPRQTRTTYPEFERGGLQRANGPMPRVFSGAGESSSADAPRIDFKLTSVDQTMHEAEVADLLVPPEPASSLPDESFDCEEGISFREDFHNIWPRLRDDTKGLVNWQNAAVIGAALGGSLIIRSELDDDVRVAVARHPLRWGDGSRTLGYMGDPIVQVPVLLGVYACSVRQQDDELHDLMGTMISAYTINGVTTVAVKAIANTDRPSDEWNDGEFGFPSFHTSSSFAMAAVLDEYYGTRAALPAYVLAGLIGWSRIDDQDHDLSDVVFGAALGWVIGKSVAGRHLYDDSRVRLLPYVHPTDGSSGLMFETSF